MLGVHCAHRWVPLRHQTCSKAATIPSSETTAQELRFQLMADKYDVILVGTGFASSLFLYRLLQRKPELRVLVLERGERHPHAWQLANRGMLERLSEASIVNQSPAKAWPFTLAFGGGSNCWWACTPRMFPDDFELRTRYGVGTDWPVRYDDLEPYYTQVEELMQVAGPLDSPFPRSKPYPLPPHRFSGPDKLLKAAFPTLFFNQPTARPTAPVAGRPACCNSGVCSLCPIDSKFTIQNGLASVYAHENVTLLTGANVLNLDVEAGVVKAVHFERQGKMSHAIGDLVGLGANGIFNPFLLQRSGLDGPHVGRGLVEQASVYVYVHLDGLDNFDGGTSITGHGYNFYSGEHRRSHAAMMIETWNVPELRMERGKWRQILKLKVIFENLREMENVVGFDQTSLKPSVLFVKLSDYADKGRQALEANLTKFLAPLPVESVHIGPLNSTEAHVLGTTVMGNDPQESVVDSDLIHHQVRNLLVLGSGTFPTAAPANPTLTLSALSLRAADRIFS